MKTILSAVIVVVAGVAGLAFVFMDVPGLPPGPALVAVAGVFYAIVGFLIGRVQSGGRPRTWALASGWGLAVLGTVGLWLAVTQPGSSDLSLALLFVLGPAVAAVIGASLGGRTGNAA